MPKLIKRLGVAHSFENEWNSWRWKQSSANPSLNAHSLFTGKIQAISADVAAERGGELLFLHRKSDGYAGIPYASEQGIFAR